MQHFWQLYSKSFVHGNILAVSQEMPASSSLFFSCLYCYHLGFSRVFPAAKSPAISSAGGKPVRLTAKDELQTHI